MMLEPLLHLGVLGLDEYAVFQVKPDRATCRVRARVLAGRFADLEEELVRLNRRGAAIFVQIQGGKSRGDRYIKRASWLYADLDRIEELPELPFVPHLVVVSGRGFHVYWQIKPLRRIDLWRNVEKALCARLGADPYATQLSQVLRLCGFDHRKEEPIKVDMHSWNPNLKPYNIEKFCFWLGIDSKRKKKAKEIPLCPLPEGKASALETSFLFPIVRHELRRQCRKIAGATKGNRYASVRDASFCLGGYMHWGLDGQVALNAIYSAVENQDWPEQNRTAKAFGEDIARWLDAGMANGPPYLKPENAKVVAEIRAGEKILEDIRRQIASWPDRLTIAMVKALVGEARFSGAWRSERQASHQIGRLLVSLGYRRVGRPGGRAVFVRSCL